MRFVIAVILSAGFFTCCVAEAQVNGKNADAIILVQPIGKGASLVVTYPNVVSHEAARQRVVRLGRIAGWSITAVEVKDDEVRTGGSTSQSTSLGKLTGVTAAISNAPLARDGGFLLQPFVQAFSDLRRIEVMFFVQKQPDFKGLREFDSKPLSIKLEKDGGPYRYAIDIKEAGVVLPNLPLTQEINVGAAPVAPIIDSGVSSRRSADIAFVLMIATGCALVVLVSLLAIARFRLGNSPASGSRRIHRS